MVSEMISWDDEKGSLAQNKLNSPKINSGTFVVDQKCLYFFKGDCKFKLGSAIFIVTKW